MSTAVLEVERTYDVDARAVVPDLAAAGPGLRVAPVEVRELAAVYLDTADLRLRSARTTLRHRTGGPDAGWHLKLPVGADRLEARVDGDDPSAPVPGELQALVRALVRDRRLEPVVELRTRRTVHALQDAEGRLLVEVVDDEVTAQLLTGGEPLHWREWEAELGDGDPALLDAVEALLLQAGARAARSTSKVGRVLEGHPAAGSAPWWRPGAELPRRATGGDVLRAHLAEQVAELVRRDPQVRRDEPDAVHKMRVATRRLRSALATFRPLLDRDRTDPLREELRHLAAVLGGARDVEVMRARVLALVAAEPDDLVLGPVQQTVDDVLGARYRARHEEVVQALDDARHLALLDALEELVADPPWRGRAARPAAQVLPPLVRKAWSRLDDVLEHADALGGADRDEALHEARKEAKRVRYACEAVAVVFPQARRLARAVTALQEHLGEHQDGVVTREVLRELGALPGLGGADGFTLGRLHALEEWRAEGTGRQWHALWAQARRRRLHRWLEP